MDTFKKALDDTTGGEITAQKERQRRQREQQKRRRLQQQIQNTRSTANTTGTSTLEESLEPVLSAEKSDLMFWMMVLEVLILVGILRNTSGG